MTSRSSSLATSRASGARNRSGKALPCTADAHLARFVLCLHRQLLPFLLEPIAHCNTKPTTPSTAASRISEVCRQPLKVTSAASRPRRLLHVALHIPPTYSSTAEPGLADGYLQNASARKNYQSNMGEPKPAGTASPAEHFIAARPPSTLSCSH